jgi:hypothetical protein
MQIGKLLRTKTFWVGVAGILSGISMIMAGQQEQGIQAIIIGLLAITGRDALLKA